MALWPTMLLYSGAMSGDAGHEVTDLLLRWRGGDTSALNELMPIAYRKLKAVAGRLLRSEDRDRVFETTALVHETYLRLIDVHRISWQDRAHFYAMCARLMRQILVDQARALGRLKRGGECLRLSIDELDPRAETTRPTDLVVLDDALRDLAKLDEERARIVEMRFFGGLDRDSIAEVTGLSSATVSRRWRSARAWLVKYVAEEAT